MGNGGKYRIIIDREQRSKALDIARGAGRSTMAAGVRIALAAHGRAAELEAENAGLKASIAEIRGGIVALDASLTWLTVAACKAKIEPQFQWVEMMRAAIIKESDEGILPIS